MWGITLSHGLSDSWWVNLTQRSVHVFYYNWTMGSQIAGELTQCRVYVFYYNWTMGSQIASELISHGAWCTCSNITEPRAVWATGSLCHGQSDSRGVNLTQCRLHVLYYHWAMGIQMAGELISHSAGYTCCMKLFLFHIREYASTRYIRLTYFLKWQTERSTSHPTPSPPKYNNNNKKQSLSLLKLASAASCLPKWWL